MKQHKPTQTAIFVGIFVLFIALQLARPINGTEILYDGDEKRSHIVSPLPHTYMDEDSLPNSFDWGNTEGRSLLTHMLNQHIPQVRLLSGFVVAVFAFYLLGIGTTPTQILRLFLTGHVRQTCTFLSPLVFKQYPSVLWSLLGAQQHVSSCGSHKNCAERNGKGH